jgi:hypothetical protein
MSLSLLVLLVISLLLVIVEELKALGTTPARVNTQ